MSLKIDSILAQTAKKMHLMSASSVSGSRSVQLISGIDFYVTFICDNNEYCMCPSTPLTCESTEWLEI